MSVAALFVEDAPDDAELLLRELRRGGLEVEWRRAETEPARREALAAACGQMAIWVAQGLEPGRMAVNLSARQFRQQDLAEVVQQALAESGLPPRMLELEITESLAMDDVAFTREVLGHLRELGVHSSLDDFGTGYSSFSHLSTLPLDVLKIDRTFVAGIGRRSSEAAIVRAEEATELLARGTFAL